jgi:hypothetical protein
MHYRHGMLGYRMTNFSLGGIWQGQSLLPARLETVDIREVPEKRLLSWLPDPKVLGMWAIMRVNHPLSQP